VVSTTNGSASAVWAMATPWIVSSIPQRMKITASGIERITIGKARVATTESRTVSEPRNEKRAIA
jgi:hypothetical protein